MPGGVAIRVIVANRVHIGPNVRILNGFDALAILAKGDVLLAGDLQVLSGTFEDPSCAGGKGRETDVGSSGLTAASGGGGFATIGAPGGTLTSIGFAGGSGGASGGMNDDRGEVQRYGGGAGGAVQISSRTKIVVDGIVVADGGPARIDQVGLGVGILGGGSGGAILLEAPSVILGPKAMLLARGGGGYANGVPPPPSKDSSPLPGTPCTAIGPACGSGGSGAAPGHEAQPGGDGTSTSGGGGGGLGRIRINTKDGVYSKANTTIEAGALSVGTLRTR